MKALGGGGRESTERTLTKLTLTDCRVRIQDFSMAVGERAGNEDIQMLPSYRLFLNTTKCLLI